jgi:hypothetical protein
VISFCLFFNTLSILSILDPPETRMILRKSSSEKRVFWGEKRVFWGEKRVFWGEKRALIWYLFYLKKEL